jgi:hypothetical protein
LLLIFKMVHGLMNNPVYIYIDNALAVKHKLASQRLRNTISSESRCALSLRYVDLVQACIDVRGHHFQNLS